MSQEDAAIQLQQLKAVVTARIIRRRRARAALTIGIPLLLAIAFSALAYLP